MLRVIDDTGKIKIILRNIYCDMTLINFSKTISFIISIITEFVISKAYSIVIIPRVSYLMILGRSDSLHVCYLLSILKICQFNFNFQYALPLYIRKIL